jgi:phage terminase large subunit
MFVAYSAMREAREENITAIDFLVDVAGLDEEHIRMFLDIAENHATAQLRALATLYDDNPELSSTPITHRNKAAKMALVMAAISEGDLAKYGKTFDSIDVEEVKEIEDPIERLKVVTNGLDPGMVNSMAEIIVDESYPDANPVKDILMALWIEGFIVSLIGDEMLEINKNDPRVAMVYEHAHKIFTVKD